MKTTRRRFLANAGRVVAGSAAMALGGRSPRARTRSLRPIRIGTFGPSHCTVPFVFAKLDNLFKKDGLKVELINYHHQPEAARHLIAGNLDFTQMIVPLVFAVHTGSGPFANKRTPLVLSQITGVNGAALMTARGSGIAETINFRGRTIASHSRYTSHYLYIRLFLERHGIDVERDVNFKIMDIRKAIQAMGQGQVDSMILPEPKNAIIEHDGFGQVYMLSRYIWPDHPCCGLAARRSLLEKEPGLYMDVLRTMTRSGLLVDQRQTRLETIRLLRSERGYGYSEIPEEVLVKAFAPGRSDFYPFPYRSSARVLLKLMKMFRLLPESFKEKQLAHELVRSDLARKVLTELGHEAPKSDYRPERVLGTEWTMDA